MGKQCKQWQILFSWAPKSLQMVTEAMKLRHMLLGRKAMTNLDSILKSRNITLPTKAHIVKAMVFPVVMYGCESWTIKKAEHRRIDAFETWFWRRLLRVPWLARRSSQSILKEVNPEYVLEGLLAEAKVPILWPPDVKSQLIGKGLDAEKEWQEKEKGAAENEMVRYHHWLNGHEFEQTMGDSGQRSLACCTPWGHKESDTVLCLNNKFSAQGLSGNTCV